MELDFWWLLAIPAIFGLGWISARLDLKHLLAENSALPRSYFRGLNFLLREQHDQAIDAFIEVAKLDPETTELHFALGNLFRRRGETGRAIRVHQNLLSRADLPLAERDHALYELGQDFLKAGFLDRAEEALTRLESGTYAADAQRSLLTIYTIEKDWPRAIDLARQLSRHNAADYHKDIAHFYCEQAEEALQHQRVPEARAALKHALAANLANVRATLLLGDAAFADGEPSAAINIWTRIEQQNPACLPLIAQRLIHAHQKLGRGAQAARLLISYIDRCASDELIDVAFPFIAEQCGADIIHTLARAQMQKSPTLVSMAHLLNVQRTIADAPMRSELDAMHAMLAAHLKNVPRYTCCECGFRARLFYWQCPGCNGWETYLPHCA
ncbi:conserved hypothetical protein; TPR domain protein [Candidatus Glomeribacter gigasporarum BEG34]|uniref:Lipopolysaccharide assembly protein B n=1 Tax=Candidatus Glomeribacter gigasporarum BEG34 TaxID=1070319 RepID=G2J9G3_9BURK|nr:lipopolysaccharide assembly protein LapB [Candidatus Glomeribacter gigasporarum]CCD29410.1 conserved hypothetical protein; TPR domain protein [Candidatus Glomeribacter gigasporarum BEG34]